MSKSIKVLYKDGAIRVSSREGLIKVRSEEQQGQNQGGGAQIYYDPGNVASYSGSGNTLNNIGSLGSTSGTTGAISGPSYNSGVAGGVFNFNGANDQITFGQFDFGNAITVSAWVYPRNEYSINTLISNASAGLATNGFKLEWNSWNTADLKMLLEAGNGSSGDVTSSESPVIEENQWQHLTWVINFLSPSVSLYRNGIQLATAGGIVSGISSNNSNWYIGSMAGSYYMNANLGELKIWLSNKSGGEILSEFNDTSPRYIN